MAGETGTPLDGFIERAERRGHRMRNESPEPGLGRAVCVNPGCKARVEISYKGNLVEILSDNATNSQCPAAG